MADLAHALANWSPADSAAGVAPNAPVSVELAPAEDAGTPRTAALELDYGTDAALANGTLTSALITGDGLELEPVSTVEDYSGATVDTNATANGWTQRTTNGTAMVRDRETPTNRLLERTNQNNNCVITKDSLGTSKDSGIIGARFYFANTNNTAGVVFNASGTGSSLRGFCVVFSSGDYVQLKRYTGDGSTYGLNSQAHGLTISASTWYELRALYVTADGTTTVYFKLWPAGSAEPESWSWLGSSNSNPSAGAIGLHFGGSASGATTWSDDLYFSDYPLVYNTAGDWQGPADSVTAVGLFASSRISWTETTPAGTSVVVNVRRGSGSWTAVTNGGDLIVWPYSTDLDGDTLEIRVVLSTTDTSATPRVEDLLVEFIPVLGSDVELTVAGVDCTIANDLLEERGELEISGGANVVDYDRAYATRGIRWCSGTGQAARATLAYKGTTVGSISFEVATFLDERMAGDVRFGFPPVSFTSRGAWLRFHVWSRDLGRGKADLKLHIVGPPPNVKADVWLYVANVAVDDFVGAMTVAHRELADTPGEVIVRGWSRDDHPGELLVQGWRRDDIPGEVLAALRSRFDFVGSATAGIARSDDHPGAVLVYGVNRAGQLEVAVISDETLAALTAAGYSIT